MGNSFSVQILVTWYWLLTSTSTLRHTLRSESLTFLLIFANRQRATQSDSGASKNCSPALLCRSVDVDQIALNRKLNAHNIQYISRSNTIHGRPIVNLIIFLKWRDLKLFTKTDVKHSQLRENTELFTTKCTHRWGKKLLTWRAKQPGVYIWISL